MSGLPAISPGWFFLPVCLLALYGTGLDFIGRFGLDIVRSVSTFATVIVTCTTHDAAAAVPGTARGVQA